MRMKTLEAMMALHHHLDLTLVMLGKFVNNQTQLKRRAVMLAFYVYRVTRKPDL
jgi:hypothetical protein